MPSLFATGSRPLPVVVRRELSRAIVVQHHRHPPPTPSVAVSGRCHSHRCCHPSCKAVANVKRCWGRRESKLPERGDTPTAKLEM